MTNLGSDNKFYKLNLHDLPLDFDHWFPSEPPLKKSQLYPKDHVQPEPGSDVIDFKKCRGLEGCRYGCVCEALLYTRPKNNHCRKVDCIFGCKCAATDDESAEVTQGKHRLWVPESKVTTNQDDSEEEKQVESDLAEKENAISKKKGTKRGRKGRSGKRK